MPQPPWLVPPVPANLNGIRGAELTVNLYVDLATDHMQLFDSCRTLQVGGYQEWLDLLFLEQLSQFSARGRLAGHLANPHTKSR